MSEQKAVPEIPEDLLPMARKLAAPRGVGGGCLDAVEGWTLLERIAAITAELAAMTKDRDLWKDDHDGDCPYQIENALLREQVEQHKLETAVALEFLIHIATAEQIHEATHAILESRARLTPPASERSLLEHIEHVATSMRSVPDWKKGSPINERTPPASEKPEDK